MHTHVCVHAKYVMKRLVPICWWLSMENDGRMSFKMAENYFKETRTSVDLYG